jgi:hypothetical protein
VSYGTEISLAYDTDYFVTVSAPTALPWKHPIGSEQWLNVKMTKATDRETKITAEYNDNDKIKYQLRAYRSPEYTVTAEPRNESYCGNPMSNTQYAEYIVYDAHVIIHSSDYNPIQLHICHGTFSYGNAVLTKVIWNDGFEPNYTNLNIGGTNTYTRTEVAGTRMEAIPGETPTDPDWNNYGPGVTVTSYSGTSTNVRDNWGYSGTAHVMVPPKVVYGAY